MDLDAPAYFAEARRLQALYESRIEIRVGAELGLQPRLGTFLDSWLEQNMAEGLSFDFLIGSTHLVDGTDPYYPEFWNGREPEASVGRFLDITLENVRAFDCFDVYGHLDYIVRYIPDGERRFSYSSHRDQVDAILKLLIEKGKGIEINTAAGKQDFPSPIPAGRFSGATGSWAAKSSPPAQTPIPPSTQAFVWKTRKKCFEAAVSATLPSSGNGSRSL